MTSLKNNKEWFEKNRSKAKEGLKNLDIKAFMEVEVYFPDINFSKDKKEVLEAARSSTIRHFGWPIGIFMDREEYKPRPDSDGIHAEVSIEEGVSGRKSYDYWSINQDGSFYLLKSLFEDHRKENEVFFNTRIVRITEVLMYLNNLYSKLEISSDKKINIKIKHDGIKGRTLTSSSPRRLMSGTKKIDSNEVTKTVETSLNEIEDDIASVVRQFTKELFVHFDFFELSEKILQDIVQKYKEEGKAT